MVEGVVVIRNFKTTKFIFFILAFLFLVSIFLILKSFFDRNDFSVIFTKIKSQTITYYKTNEDILNKLSNDFIIQKQIIYIRLENQRSNDMQIFYARFSKNQDKLYKFSLNSKIQLKDKNSDGLQTDITDIEILENNLIISLEDFEKKYSIKIDFFDYWIQILKTYDLTSISKGMWFNNSIVFSLNSGGKLVNQIDNLKLQNSTNEVDYLEKIDSNWYFYFEKDTAGFF